MNFELNDSQLMITNAVRDFAERNIRPHVMEWDETQHFPKDVLQQLGKLGALGVFIPAEYGGRRVGLF